MRVLAWGTYDLSKPRFRILLQALRERGHTVETCHSEVWRGLEDKSRISGLSKKAGLAVRWLLSYPKLIWCLFRHPRPDVILVGYLGHFDVIVLWLFARLRGVPVAWDAFVSLYDTVITDRGLYGSRHPLAWLLAKWDWLATRVVDRVILDTQAHADFFADRFQIPHAKLGVVPVGAEPTVFKVGAYRRNENAPFTVMFYGQFIPLHGIDTIIAAARLLNDKDIRWILIGDGQLAEQIDRELVERPLPRVERVAWVRYEDLPECIGRADVCLGIFDDGPKAGRVIPNKVYQVLACGMPLITRDSPAIRELIPDPAEGVMLVPPADPAGLANAVLAMKGATRASAGVLHEPIRNRFRSEVLGDALSALLVFDK